MFNIPTWVGVLGGLIGIISALVSVTVYITKLRIEGNRKMKAYEEELKEKRSTIAALESSVQGLTQSLLLLRKGREDAYKLLTELNSLLGEIRNANGATADSILIRDPFAEETLIFLTVHGEAAEKIKRMKVSVKESQAGKVFQRGVSSIFPEPSSGGHARHTDKKAGYQTQSMMTVPLSIAGETVGVVQFLNKRDGAPFTGGDLAHAQQLSADLAVRVRTLAADQDALKWLGIAEVADNVAASILFTDITQSHSLFENLQTTEVMDLFNEYFDRLGSIALRYGGTIDKFLGDGFMARFNVPRRIADFQAAAIKAAVAMQTEFNQIQTEWQRLGRPVKEISNRIGVASGPVIGSMIGHPQYLSYTVMGQPVNSAAYLCDEARRTQSGVLICRTTFEAVEKDLSGVARFVPRDFGSGDRGFEVQPLPGRA
ncbi:MAG: adenylate/guanylate cyclase domain-containing protein [Candidatus Binatia bacterium]